MMTYSSPDRNATASFFVRFILGVGTADEKEWRLLGDRAELLYQQTLPGLIVHAIVVITTTYSMSHAPNAGMEVFAWGGAMIVLGLMRALVIVRMKPMVKDDPVRALMAFYGIIGLTGIGWGIGGVFILPSNALPQQIFFIMMLGGTAAGTVATLAPFLSAQILALTTSVMPLMIRMAFEGGEDQILMAAALLMFVLAMLATGRNTHAAIVNGLRLRLENIDLLENLRRKSEELELSSRVKTRFLAAASHDLRQPLHALRLQSESLAIRASNDPRIQSVTDRIGRSVGAMERLLNSLLDISRLDAGVIMPHYAAFRIDSVLKTLENEFRAATGIAGSRLHIVYCSAVVHTDATLLETILRNLVSNAIRYAPGAKILVGCLRRGNILRLIVADNGPGIPQQMKERVFDEFFQIGNPERDRSKGLGLGLSIVKRLTALLELPLQFESREGGGTFFSIDIPIGSTARQHPLPAIPHRHVMKSGHTIWIIDDDEQGRVALADVVEAWGCQTRAAADFRTLLGDGNPDTCAPGALLVDYRLRGSLTGLDVIREIQHFFKNETLPAIIITGDTAPDRLQELQSSGVHILHKPVAPGRLRALLTTLMTENSPRA